MTWAIERNEDGQNFLTYGGQSWLLTSEDLELMKSGLKAEVTRLINDKRRGAGTAPNEDDLSRVREETYGRPFQSAVTIPRR